MKAVYGAQGALEVLSARVDTAMGLPWRSSPKCKPTLVFTTTSLGELTTIGGRLAYLVDDRGYDAVMTILKTARANVLKLLPLDPAYLDTLALALLLDPVDV